MKGSYILPILDFNTPGLRRASIEDVKVAYSCVTGIKGDDGQPDKNIMVAELKELGVTSIKVEGLYIEPIYNF